jgi:hypothetical protein
MVDPAGIPIEALSFLQPWALTMPLSDLRPFAF